MKTYMDEHGYLRDQETGDLIVDLLMNGRPSGTRGILREYGSSATRYTTPKETSVVEMEDGTRQTVHNSQIDAAQQR